MRKLATLPGSILYFLLNLISVVVLGLFIERIQQSSQKMMLREVGNPGYSPAAAWVMHLYREGRLSGKKSILRGKNLMGANWQRVILPEVDLEGANLNFADLRDSMLSGNFKQVNFWKANLSGARLGGEIKHANFMEANLQKANLSGSHAHRTSFYMAKAAGARMGFIHLRYADLADSDFRGVYLSRADLSHTLLRETNFARANLEKTNLCGAAMMNANLIHANLTGAYFDGTTILPDAKFAYFDEQGHAIYDKYWTPETDMSRYTDPNHPDFWRSALQDWVNVEDQDK